MGPPEEILRLINSDACPFVFRVVDRDDERDEKDRDPGAGVAVLVSDKGGAYGYALTCWHNIDWHGEHTGTWPTQHHVSLPDRIRVVPRWENELLKGGERVELMGRRSNHRQDVAVLQLPRAVIDKFCLRPAPISFHVRRGAEVVARGYDRPWLRASLTLYGGAVPDTLDPFSVLGGTHRVFAVRLKAAWQRGMSGGAVFDLDQGALIGIACRVKEVREGQRQHAVTASHQEIGYAYSMQEVAESWTDVRGECHVVEPPPPPPESVPFHVPFLPNPDFVGRDADLEQLHELLSGSDSPVGIRPTVLVGMGGIGKTQLAVEYCHAHKRDYPRGVFWLNAANPLLHEFANAAEALGLADADTPREQAARAAWRYFDAGPDALVVIDHVEDPATLNVPFARELVTANLGCRTLFTTRERTFPAGFAALEVTVLPEDAAMQLLLRGRKEALEETHAEWGRARIVCASLGWLPLALHLASAYLARYPEVGVGEYLGRLRREGRLDVVDDTELRKKDLPTRHPAAVDATLRSHWIRLEDQDAKLLFQAAGQSAEATWIPSARLGLLTGVSSTDPGGTATPLRRALKTLHDLSLLEKLEEDQLRLHPLVREFSERLDPPPPSVTVQEWRAAMADTMADALAVPATMEEQVKERGVYPVLDDLRGGLSLVIDQREKVRGGLETLERVLGREAHHLVDWDPGVWPVGLRQQLGGRARALGLTEMADAYEGELGSGTLPYLRLEWLSPEEDPALLRILEGHTSSVESVAVTPDGRRAVSGSSRLLKK